MITLLRQVACIVVAVSKVSGAIVAQPSTEAIVIGFKAIVRSAVSEVAYTLVLIAVGICFPILAI